MSGETSAASAQGSPVGSALKVCLDANIWIAALIAAQKAGRARPSAAVTMVSTAWQMRAFGSPLQLVVSHELVDTVVRVAERLGHSTLAAKEWGASIVDLTLAGPSNLDPMILVPGRDQLAMHDREDAGVLAICIAARADLLVTDNLKDFVTNDSVQIDTQEITYQSGGKRQLFAIIHKRADNVSLVVMHPLDVRVWLEKGVRPTAAAVRAEY